MIDLNLTQLVLNDLSELVYENAEEKGFHEADNGRSVVENFAVWTANLHGEVSELWEAARKNQLFDTCDKDCGLTCEEEELADIIIRALDTAHARGINIGHAVLTKHEYNTTRHAHTNTEENSPDMTAEEITSCKKAVAVLRTLLSGICEAVDIDEDTSMRVKSHDATLMEVSVKEALKMGDDTLALLNQHTPC